MGNKYVGEAAAKIRAYRRARKRQRIFRYEINRHTYAFRALKIARRPQTPKPPYPYTSIDTTFENSEAGITLAGTNLPI